MGDEERDAIYLRDHRVAAAERHLDTLDDRVRDLENRMIRVDAKLDTVIEGQERAEKASFAAKDQAAKNVRTVIVGVIVTVISTVISVVGTHFYFHGGP